MKYTELTISPQGLASATTHTGKILSGGRVRCEDETSEGLPRLQVRWPKAEFGRTATHAYVIIRQHTNSDGTRLVTGERIKRMRRG